MQHFSKFIVDNWLILLSAVILILTFILQLIKKKPLKVVNGLYESIYQWCINAINTAEETDLDGKGKKDFALDYVRNRIEEIFPAVNFYDYSHLISLIIELILSTPTKKGGYGREKEVITKGK